MEDYSDGSKKKDQVKSAWAERQLEFWETKISGIRTLVSVYAIRDRRLRFNFIVFHKNSFWAMDFYAKSHKGSEYYRDNQMVPKIPQKIIESARINIVLNK